jgi:hypothetical protein
MAADKKITWCFPELRTHSGFIAPGLKLEHHQLSLLNNNRNVSRLSSYIWQLLHIRLYESNFLLPNTTAIDFDLKDSYTNEFIKLGGWDQIAVVRLILDYPMFINLPDLDKRLYVLDKIVYAYQKLAELAGVATTELTNAAANIIGKGFKRVITYKAKTSRNRAYQATKMYIPYFGYRDWYIWVKVLETNETREIFLFREDNHEVGGKWDNMDIFERMEIHKYSEKIHGWNKQNEFQISWGRPIIFIIL